MDAIQASHSNKILAVLCNIIFSLMAISLLAGCGGFGGPNTQPQFNFSMSVSPATQSIIAGNGVIYKVVISPAALIGAVDLSIAGLPQNLQASFSPGFDIDGSRTLGIFTTETTPAGNYQATITAINGTTTRTANLTLTIAPPADFTLGVTPNQQTLKAGSSTTYTVNVNFTGAESTPVMLSTQGLPNGATASFAPASLTASGSSTLTLATGPELSNQFYSFNIVGTDSAGTFFIPVSFEISPADFTLNQTFGSLAANAGAVLTGQIDVDGPAAAVSLSTSNLPAGITVSINPPVVTGSHAAQVTVTTDVSTPPGSYTLEFIGADNSGQRSTSLPLTIAPTNANAGFFLTANPVDQQILVGSSASYNIGISAPGGTIPQLVFSVGSSISGVTGAILPANNNPATFVLQVSTSLSAGGAAGIITVTATGPDGSQSINVNLETSVPPPPEPPPDPPDPS